MTNKFSLKTLKTGSLLEHKILVTGSSGYIGNVLVPELINEGAQVIGVDFQKPNENFEKFPNSSFTFFKGEFQGLEDKLIKNVKSRRSLISCVIHLAGMSNISECNLNPSAAFHSNVGLTIEVLEFCKQYNIKRFIFPSTALIYGYQKNSNPLGEDSKEQPANIYAWTKLSAEKMIHGYSENYGLISFIGRLSNVYGSPIKINTVFSDILSQVLSKNNEIVIKDGNLIRDFVFVYDVISAFISFIKLRDENNYNVFNISQGIGTSIFELAETICEINSVPKSTVKSQRPIIGNIRPALILDNTKLKNTGWKPQYSLKEGLKIIIDKPGLE